MPTTAAADSGSSRRNFDAAEKNNAKHETVIAVDFRAVKLLLPPILR